MRKRGVLTGLHNHKQKKKTNANGQKTHPKLTERAAMINRRDISNTRKRQVHAAGQTVQDTAPESRAILLPPSGLIRHVLSHLHSTGTDPTQTDLRRHDAPVLVV